MGNAQTVERKRADVRVAAPARNAPQPAFTVRKLEGEVERSIFFYDEKGKRQTKKAKEPIGYVVSFSKGHSIRIKNDAELARLGYDQTIPLVDANDDVHGYLPNNIFADSENEIIDIDKM